MQQDWQDQFPVKRGKSDKGKYSPPSDVPRTCRALQEFHQPQRHIAAKSAASEPTEPQGFRKRRRMPKYLCLSSLLSIFSHTHSNYSGFRRNTLLIIQRPLRHVHSEHLSYDFTPLWVRCGHIYAQSIPPKTEKRYYVHVHSSQMLP